MTQITPSTPSRSDRRRLASRAALVRATQELIASDGLSFSVQQVADRADVALATLYNHFPSKQDLVVTAAGDSADRVEAYLEERTADIADPLARLAMRGRLHGRLLASHPLEARVLLATAIEVAAMDSAMRGETLQLAQQVAESRDITADDVRLLGTIAYATNQHLMAHQLSDPAHGTGDVDRLVALLMRMAGLPPDEADALAHGPLPVD